MRLREAMQPRATMSAAAEIPADVDPDWSFAQLPIGRVVHLGGVPFEVVAAALDPLPDDAPAVLSCHLGAARTSSEVVGVILDELETAAIHLFPAWLPGGDDIDGRSSLDVHAVRVLAKRLASTTRHFGPFVADLAEAALRGTRLDPDRYAPETRVAGLSRVLADSYSRERTALAITAADDVSVDAQWALAAACEWLADHGRVGVWLVGAPMPAVDRFSTVSVRLPVAAAGVTGEASPPLPVVPQVTRLQYPALVGRPHPGSTAEQKLEAALSDCEWARGRVWNMPHRSNRLQETIRVDLMWPDARCVVEVDGDDHRMREKYAADRRRDVRLQLDGYGVLRFTNEQVFDDVSAVVADIERYVRDERRELRTQARPEGMTL